MELSTSNVVSIVAMIGSVMGCIITYLYTQPLKLLIANLNKSVDKLSDTIEVDRKEVKHELIDLRERITKVEASTASAHKRLDTLKK